MSMVFTYSQARAQLASLLDRADLDGEVKIRRRDGRVFVLKPDIYKDQSPFDVPGVDLNVSTSELVEAVHESRRPRR